MDRKRHPFQSFALIIEEMQRLCVALSDNVSSKDQLASALQQNTPKVDVMLEWGNHLGLLEGKEVTWIGRALIERSMNVNHLDSLLELLYYNLCRNHVICDLIVNKIAYKAAFSYPSTFTKQEALTLLDNERSNLIELSSSSGKQMEKGLKFALNALTEDRSLGYITGIVQSQGFYHVAPRIPSFIGSLLIIVKALRPGQVAIKLQDIISGDNMIGKLFRLDEAQVLYVLSDLETRKYIQIHRQAGLNQIMMNTTYSPEMLWKELTT